MLEAAASACGNESLEEYYTQFWNTRDLPVDAQMLRGFVVTSDAHYSAEHFGRMLGFDRTGLSFMEIMKDSQHTKDMRVNRKFPSHSTKDSLPNKDVAVHPSHPAWKTFLEQSGDYMPDTKRLSIATQRLDGWPVFGPEYPPHMI